MYKYLEFDQTLLGFLRDYSHHIEFILFDPKVNVEKKSAFIELMVQIFSFLKNFVTNNPINQRSLLT